MRIMARLDWDHTSASTLAEQWGLLPGTVCDYACEASRRIHAIVNDDAEIQSILRFSLMDIARDCRDGKRKERRTAVEALRVLAGVVAAKKERVAEAEGTPRFVIELSTAAPAPCTPAPIQPTPNADLEIPAKPEAS